MRTRGAGASSSLPAVASALSTSSRAIAGIPMASRDAGQLRRGHRLVLVDGHRDDAAGEPGKIAQEAFASLVESMPTIRMSGRETRSSRSASAAAMARPPSALWPPSSQSSLSGGSNVASRPLRKPLHARRPVHADHAGLEGGGRQFQAADAQAPRWRCRHSRIDAVRRALAPADRASRRRPDRPAGRVLPSPSSSSPAMESGAFKRAACRSMTASASRVWPAITAGTPDLRMPAFSAAIASMVSPRKSRWSSETRVITLAIGLSTTLVASSRPPRPTSSRRASAGCRAKRRNAAAVSISNTVIGSLAVVGLALRQRVGKLIVLDELAAAGTGNAEALIEPDQIGRRVDVHALAGRFEDRAGECDGRALAIGPGYMDHRRQMPLRMTERRKQAFDAHRATDRCVWDAAPAIAREWR